MIDYANTLLSLIQSAACSARVPAGTDRRMCAHYTTNPLSNCVLGLQFSLALARIAPGREKICLELPCENPRTNFENQTFQNHYVRAF